MTGSGHSFTPTAVTDGVLLRPGNLTAIRSVDTAAGTVTVEAGCPLHVLNAALLARGLSLANMGDIQVQTVAGATQTGTHGTGRDVGGMAAQIAGLELVLADGRIVTCSAESPSGGLTGPDGADINLFDAARVGLGALGVVTAVTFRVVPAFLLQAREEPMTWSQVISQLDELCADNEHFEFYWFPHSEGCLTKRNNRTDGPGQPAAALALPARRRVPVQLAVRRDVPARPPGARRDSGRQLGRPPGHLAPAPIPTLPTASSPARGASGSRSRNTRFRALPCPTCSPRCAHSSAAGTGASASPSRCASRRPTTCGCPPPTAATARTSPFTSSTPRRTRQYFTDVEAIMTAVGGRPHWGKMHTRDAALPGRRVPEDARLRRVRDQLDPERRFGNGYLRQVLGS